MKAVCVARGDWRLDGWIVWKVSVRPPLWVACNHRRGNHYWGEVRTLKAARTFVRRNRVRR